LVSGTARIETTAVLPHIPIRQFRGDDAPKSGAGASQIDGQEQSRTTGLDGTGRRNDARLRRD